MLNIFGKVQVTNLKAISEKMIVGTLITYEKVGEEFKATFINAKFVGKACSFILENSVMDKDKVYVESGILGTREYNEQKTIQATVFELKALEEEAPKTEEVEKAAKEVKSFKR